MQAILDLIARPVLLRPVFHIKQNCFVVEFPAKVTTLLCELQVEKALPHNAWTLVKLNGNAEVKQN